MWCSPELVLNQSCSVKSSMQAGVTMSNAFPETLVPMSCSQVQQHIDGRKNLMVCQQPLCMAVSCSRVHPDVETNSSQDKA